MLNNVTREQVESALSQAMLDMPYSCGGAILERVNELINGYGVDYAAAVGEVTPRGIEYVNLGDTYDVTAVYDYDSRRFFVSSWGDIIESDNYRWPTD